jgi:hypothetical protein
MIKYNKIYHFETTKYLDFESFLNSYIKFEFLTDNNLQLDNNFNLDNIKKTKLDKMLYLITNTNYNLTLFFTQNCNWNLMEQNISDNNRYLIKYDDYDIIYKNNAIYISVLPYIHIKELKKTWTLRDENDDIIDYYKFSYNIKFNKELYIKYKINNIEIVR